MSIVDFAVTVFPEQCFFLFIKGRFLLEEPVINPASVCAQITDDRHAVHIASEDDSSFIHGQAKGVGNGVFYGLLRNGIQKGDIGYGQQIDICP